MQFVMTSVDGLCAGLKVKRRERVLADGCSCHHSAVAVAALAQYTRYIIEAQHQLQTTDA